MKKTMIILMIIMVISVSPIQIFSATQTFSWYCVRNKDHKQPRLDNNMSFITEYGGYYVDKAHGDDNEEKVIYLTFDAGYENGNVSKILDTLKKEDVKATFFVLDHLVCDNLDIIERMIEEGHVVANHTAKHRDISNINTKEEFANELSALETIFKEKTGKDMPKYFRPPEGRFSLKSLQFAHELGYKTIFWSFAYADWDNNNQMSNEAAMKKIMDNIHNGAILLLHPTSATNAAIMEELIVTLKADGYNFRTVCDLT